MMTPIKLIVGLGNIGDKYAQTRHNAGFWWLDLLARQHNATFKADAKYFGEIAKISLIGAGEVWLLKPHTFMNASGKAVAAICNYYKIAPHEILIAHDELDLTPGIAKLKLGGGRSGNGIKDIIAALGTQDFWRLRIGIGRPSVQGEMANYVLDTPSRDENYAIENSLYAASGQVDLMIKGDFESAMLKLHTK